jgi:hypothetical protein
VDGGVLAGRFLDREQVFGLVSRRAAVDETSAVHVSGQHPCRESGGRGREQSRTRSSAHGQEWDLVKREVTSRDQISVQLESLILAQSERWRQA